MMQQLRLWFCHYWYVLVLLTLVSCAPTRHLSEDAYLLRKVNVKLNAENTLSEKGTLNEQLNYAILQRPNTYISGMFPYKVWLYNIRHKKYSQDSTNFQIKSSIVEKPVVFDAALIPRSKKYMEDFLYNSGYFYAKVNSEVKYKGRKAYVTYNVQTGSEYIIDLVDYTFADSTLAGLKSTLTSGSLLVKGKPYSNTLVGMERNRLANAIRNQGYYRFGVNGIDFTLDTMDKSYLRDLTNPFETAVNIIALNKQKKKPTLNIKVAVNKTDDSLEFTQYTINKVIVIPDYIDSLDLNQQDEHVTYRNGIEFRADETYVNNAILDKKIFLRPDSLYAINNYNFTLRQLNDLGIFQFVRIFVLPDRTDSLSNKLNCYILMNKNKKFDIGANVEVSGGDLYALGTAANLSLSDKNFLKGANELVTTVSYGIELGQNRNLDVPYLQQLYLFSQNTGVNFRFTSPKFLLPVNQDRFKQSTLPRTVFMGGINSLNRSQYFTLFTVNASYGYVWRSRNNQSWNIKPVFVNTLNMRNITADFRARMDSVPAIRNSYQETFIEGQGIEYVYNTEGRSRNKYAYLKLGFEEAGALLSGVKSLSSALSAPMDFNHAQYVKFDFDARQYFRTYNSSFAFRFYGGVGIPYGKATILPYVKQYFVGGAYSIRGWRPRVLGPGSYYDLQSQTAATNLFTDQAGDIKLELNAEYRFNLIKLFAGGIHVNGAVFTDMGNIWLTNEQPGLSGANFELRNLYSDLALSSGAGLRFDLGGFFVVRFDWAIPLKKPYVLENNGWIFKYMQFNDAGWRKENINFNLAFGYPF